MRRNGDAESVITRSAADLDYFAVIGGVDVDDLDCQKVKEYYDMGFWTKPMVYDLVCWWLTPKEYQIITGEKFE